MGRASRPSTTLFYFLSSTSLFCIIPTRSKAKTCPPERGHATHPPASKYERLIWDGDKSKDHHLRRDRAIPTVRGVDKKSSHDTRETRRVDRATRHGVTHTRVVSPLQTGRANDVRATLGVCAIVKSARNHPILLPHPCIGVGRLVDSHRCMETRRAFPNRVPVSGRYSPCRDSVIGLVFSRTSSWLSCRALR